MKMSLLVLIVVLSVSAFGQTAPEGWRFPNRGDVKGDWKKYQRKNGLPYKVAADLNGDKFPDQAWILISTKEKNALGLFIFPGKKKGFEKAILLERSGIEPQAMYVSILKKGNYSTACAAGFRDCAEDEPALVKLKRSGIIYAMLGSANTLHYWDDRRKKFKLVALTD